MKKIKTTIVLALVVSLWSVGTILGQDHDTGLTPKQAKVVIDSIGNKLKSDYIFPEIAEQMISKMKSNLKKGQYASIDDPQKFATKLTEDLQSISHDKHLRVMFSPARIAAQKKVVTAADSVKFRKERINRMKRDNFGFKEVKILAGNIGYLDLRGFSDTEYAGETAVATMNFLSNADAIIIDLRQNGGGSPAMIQLITSYLYGAEPVHLNNFYWRPTDTHTQTWTLPHVSGKRNPDADVYVLTSNRTFSAAEEFSYNLKNLKRATLIGETTGGGAHPGGTAVATDRFAVWLPSGRAINPITNTNWEGTGVAPHIAVPVDQALKVARIKALESFLEKTEDPQMKHYYEWHLSTQKVLLNPVTVAQDVLKSYTGTYGERRLTLEHEKLYYKRGAGQKHELIPISKNEFMVEGIAYFRIGILSENNKVLGLEGRYDNGRTDKDLKSK